MIARSLVFGGLQLLLASSILAQPLRPSDPYGDYERVLQLADATDRILSFNVRPFRMECRASGDHPWKKHLECPALREPQKVQVGAVSPYTDVFVNTVRPFGQNDGRVWQGAGATSVVGSGATVKYRFIRAMLRPQVIYTQNADFEHSRLPYGRNQSIYAYPYRTDIDWPQRFGQEPWAEVALDGSYVQLEYRALAAGLSTQNMWWGPAIRNSVVMSNNAGAFPHYFIGTYDPVKTPVGGFEGRWIWGSLSHSDYFVDASYDAARRSRGSEANDRFVSGLTATWNPRWTPGLYIGAAQVFMLHHSVERKFFRDYLGVINLPFFNSDDPRRRGTDDKVVSLFARWVHPNSGVEVYGEWGRGDHTSNFRDFFVEPDHARGWTLGLQKIFKPADRIWTRLIGEVTNLERPRESGSRAGRSSYFYTHQSIRQGYTHNGQIIGAGIGPGSSGQWIQYDVFAPWGRVGVHFVRWIRDNDRYFIYHLANLQRGWDYETELGGGASFLAFWRGFEIGGAVTYTQLMNRDYVSGNDVPNVNLQFSIRKQLMGIR